MRSLAVSNHFKKQIKKLSPALQKKALGSLEELLDGLRYGSIPQGLGFKKINHDKYEIRVDIRTRSVMKSDENTLVCHLVGDHETVKRYLREYRNK